MYIFWLDRSPFYLYQQPPRNIIFPAETRRLRVDFPSFSFPSRPRPQTSCSRCLPPPSFPGETTPCRCCTASAPGGFPGRATPSCDPWDTGCTERSRCVTRPCPSACWDCPSAWLCCWTRSPGADRGRRSESPLVS